MSQLRHIIVTGGTGYIGSRLVQHALARGLCVTALGRAPLTPAADAAGRLRWRQWSLADPVPADALAGDDRFPPADAVIHLAHQWVSRVPENADENLSALDRLLAATRRQGIRRFVFCSSVSARQDALNRYGRVKWKSEQKLEAPGEIAVRVGLVYGGSERGQWGLLCRLVRSSPVLPMVGVGRPVQPIHVDDVCEGLLRLAGVADPRRAVFGLAAPEPLPFGRFLGMVARAEGRRLLVLPLPAIFGFLLATLAPTNIAERIRGLLGMTAADCRDDLTEIGLTLRDLPAGLLGCAAVRRRLLAEGRVLLRYLLDRPPSPAALRRYARGVARHGDGRPLLLPRAASAWPVVLGIFEPVFRRPIRHGPEGLRQRLDMAMRLIEATPEGALSLYGGRRASMVAALLSIALTMAGEIALLPLRLIFGVRSR